MFPRDPQEPRLITWVRNPSVRRTLILLMLWVFVAAVLFSARQALLPFGVAILLAFIIEPFVHAATRRPVFGRMLPRVVVVIGIYLVVLASIYVFAASAVPQIGAEVAKLGSEARELVATFETRSGALMGKAEALAERLNIPVAHGDIENFVRVNLQEGSAALRRNATHILGIGRDVVASVVQIIFGFFLVLMLTAFISVDRHRIERFAKLLVPIEYQQSYGHIVRGVSTSLAGVVRGQLMICLTNGVLTFVGLWLLEVRFPFLLATMAALFSLIPIFGSIISTLPIVAIGLTDSFAKGFFSLLWIVGIHLVEANLLNPKIMGDAAKIHPVIVVFVLIVGEQTAGLIGALFAVPIASVVLTIFKFLHQRALNAQDEMDAMSTVPVSTPAPIATPAGLNLSPRPSLAPGEIDSVLVGETGSGEPLASSVEKSQAAEPSGAETA